VAIVDGAATHTFNQLVELVACNFGIKFKLGETAQLENDALIADSIGSLGVYQVLVDEQGTVL